jgi:hypothetical protein
VQAIPGDDCATPARTSYDPETACRARRGRWRSTSNRTHGPVTRRGDVLLPDVAYARVSAAQWAAPIPPLPKSHNHCAEPLFGHAPGVAVMIATISRVVAVVCRGNTDWDIPA